MEMFGTKELWKSICWIIMLSGTCGLFIDYTENTELIQQRAGFDVKLQCNLKGLVDESKITDVKIHWLFKQCGDNLPNVNTCHEFYEDDWTQLPCEPTFCNSELLLRNVTEKYSGLYKCTVYPYRLEAGQALDIQLVRTFQLDVKNTSTAVPEFLDYYPLNQTTKVGTQVVFQCRVHSEVHPTIKWFRRIPEVGLGMEYALANENFNAPFVRYNGRTYELLAKAREKFISDEIYLSKLILNDVRLQDEGYYACVAVSYRGHRIREAYLAVSAAEENEYWTDYDDSDEAPTDPSEFWLLFLMPLGLALLPLSVWLSYVIYKRCKGDSGRTKSVGVGTEQYSDEEVAPDRCMLRA